MPTPGYVFKDGQPVPDDELAAQAQQAPHAPPPGAGPRDAAEAREDANSGADPAATRQTSATTTGEAVNTPASSKPSSRAGNGRDGEAPTESHALAQADHEEKGAAQEEHFEAEVRDLGWNEQPQEVPAPLVGGMQNEELWMLVRRFNKVGFTLVDGWDRDWRRRRGRAILMAYSKCIMSRRSRIRLWRAWI